MGRWVWTAMTIAVGAQFALGMVTLLLAPIGRPSGLEPHRGRLVYEVHGIVGAVLLAGSVMVVVLARRAPAMERAAALVGLGAVLVAGIGGLMTTSHGLRSIGIALMFVGSMAAGLAYLAGAFEGSPPAGSQG